MDFFKWTHAYESWNTLERCFKIYFKCPENKQWVMWNLIIQVSNCFNESAVKFNRLTCLQFLRVCVCTYTYSDLLHENSIGGLCFMQEAVHVLHTAGGCAQFLT